MKNWDKTPNYSLPSFEWFTSNLGEGKKNWQRDLTPMFPI